MKITIIFPAREMEVGRAMIPVMPLAPTLLAALTPPGHEVKLVDMVFGDQVDYDAPCDLAALTVRTPLAVKAYEIADRFLARGTPVVLGGPHIFTFPAEARGHATSVAVGEAEELWPRILEDRAQANSRIFMSPVPTKRNPSKAVFIMYPSARTSPGSP